jgi:hypothetical protein
MNDSTILRNNLKKIWRYKMKYSIFVVYYLSNTLNQYILILSFNNSLIQSLKL